MLKRSCSLLIGFGLFYSCSQKGSDRFVLEQADSLPSLEAVAEEVNELAKELPSPVDIVLSVNETQLAYSDTLVNNPRHYAHYLTTSFKKSANLGIYLTDMGYCALYQKTDKALTFLQASKKILDDLNIVDGLDQQMAARFEANVENRDSLIYLWRESYFELDSYLRRVQKTKLAIYVMFSSWVEGMYLATAFAEKLEGPNRELLIRSVAFQKPSVSRFLSIARRLRMDESNMDMLSSLEALDQTFRAVNIGPADSLVDVAQLTKAEDLTKAAYQELMDNVEISDSTFYDIQAKIKHIRWSIVSH
ncbi:MAG: hypothetical protein HC842_00110 [Cytophagales bacterium]|nr:hypothetical protein [Cytophagales bacterium]